MVGMELGKVLKKGKHLAIRILASGWQAVVFLHQKNIFRSNNKMKLADIGNKGNICTNRGLWEIFYGGCCFSVSETGHL